MIKMVLFDLDGTLLPMDQDLFVKAYFAGIAKKLANHGYEPNELMSGIWEGTKSMILNDGSKTNEETFWSRFSELYGQDKRIDEPYFNQYYSEDFEDVKITCGFNPKSKELIDKIKGLGLRVALATNPIFPQVATFKRIKWAGLDKDDFELVTTYENSSYCKPKLEYYKEIINKLGVLPEECIMIGNDVNEDMVVTNLGMKVFLLTDCLINKNDKDITKYPNGNFDNLFKFIDKINE